MEPTFVLLGSDEPFFNFTLSMICTAAGGVLITKSNDLSLYTVITHGNTFPGLSCVRALYCLQNSIMLTPFAPSAGPTGGAGLAWPPLICNLINAATSLAIVIYIMQSSVSVKGKLYSVISLLRVNTCLAFFLYLH